MKTTYAENAIGTMPIGGAVSGYGPERKHAWQPETSWLPSEELLRESCGLSRKETRVARLLACGRSNADIAAALFISPHTARHHTERIFDKLAIRSRAQVAAALLAAPSVPAGPGAAAS